MKHTAMVLLLAFFGAARSHGPPHAAHEEGGFSFDLGEGSAFRDLVDDAIYDYLLEHPLISGDESRGGEVLCSHELLYDFVRVQHDDHPERRARALPDGRRPTLRLDLHGWVRCASFRMPTRRMVVDQQLPVAFSIACGNNDDDPASTRVHWVRVLQLRVPTAGGWMEKQVRDLFPAEVADIIVNGVPRSLTQDKLLSDYERHAHVQKRPQEAVGKRRKSKRQQPADDSRATPTAKPLPPAQV
eukprot:TRINITY_DN5254_c0_g1_i1.p1 TRINITY_DN5254_c0_g1~~TRINITY_DN5254_c0_g1_i1.p1  ORF type:complete len:243 (-),score=70.50 TRINITY_DN5254_c0_g1_i1:862-1590(-)